MGLFDTFWSTHQQNEIDTANRVNSDLKNQNLDQEITLKNNQDLMHTMQMRIIELEAKLNQAKGTNFRVADLERKVKELEEDAREYQKDSRELRSVQQKNNPFAESKQISTLAQFMVWEKAYKEQAINYGLALGKTQEEILQDNLYFQETVKSQQSNFGNNIPENILLDSEEFNIKQKQRLVWSKKRIASSNELLAQNNQPLREDDSETKYPVVPISENLADYETASAQSRKERKLKAEKEQREYERQGRIMAEMIKK